MRRDIFIAMVAVFLVAASCFAAGSVRASGSSDFAAWAMSKSSECDSRWMSIVADAHPDASASRQDGTQTPSVLRSSDIRDGSGTKLSHRIIDSRSFVHRVGGDFQFLPRIAHERGGPARGVTTLRNPAGAQLNVPYSVRRPLNSSIQQRTFLRSFGDVVRPRLKSFGRMHTAEHLFNRTVARPAYRAARPRLL
jgi:hypothetical protein